MEHTVSDTKTVTLKRLAGTRKKLDGYRETLQKRHRSGQIGSCPEYALFYPENEGLRALARSLKADAGGVKLVLLIGIGGSSAGAEAVHAALPAAGPELIVLDALSSDAIENAMAAVRKLKRADELRLVVVSKSGKTTETLANVAVVLRLLKAHFKRELREHCHFVGDPDTPLLQAGKKLGASTHEMPKAIGGRFSVGTEVGAVPLALLGHDVASFLDGLAAANAPKNERSALAGAARLHLYMTAGYRHYDFFAFSSDLSRLGAWYRQLLAESTGKSRTRRGGEVRSYFVPTISAPVELHSTAQLYLSGTVKVYTEFVSWECPTVDHKIGRVDFAPHLFGRTVEEVAAAIRTGVLAAYKKTSLPYRTTILGATRPEFELGLFMGLRMREVIYLCELMDVNAFDQPNVESYKTLAAAALLA